MASKQFTALVDGIFEIDFDTKLISDLIDKVIANNKFMFTAYISEEDKEVSMDIYGYYIKCDLDNNEPDQIGA